MYALLLYCFATVGMTSIIVQGVIFQPFRQFIGNWAEKVHIQREEKAQAVGKRPRRALIEWFDGLINCAQCTGFWCGLFCGYWFFAMENLFVWFCYGLAGSFLASFGCNFGNWMFYRKMNALRQLEEQDLILADLHAQREHHHVHDHQEHVHQEHDHDH